MQQAVENVAAAAEAVVPDCRERARRGRILVMENPERARQTIGAITNWMDVDVDTAENGRIACILATIALAEGRPYRAVLIDMQWPLGGGAEAGEWIEQHLLLQGPIIGVGADVSDEDRKRFLGSSCDSFIDRPVTDAKLRSALSQLAIASDRAASAAAESDETISNVRKTPKMHGRALVAEDAVCMQMIVGAFLERMNFEVDMADNGQVACEMAMNSLAKERPYDVILMDIQMPKMNGKQAAKWLRENGWKGPIIAVSSHNTAKDHAAFLTAGCNDFITKPLTKTDVEKMLSQYLHCE
jgi:two-component system, sensor histidine kinase and response regulator